ncbi:VanZ family protein [Alteripontixanthobacter muriae]|uniref:hypothetical protein n=1 Tax=Alteripontixanthobacter muriae TaxID=2705546 RepID=UPI001576A5B8|nr:hypothetical protein [Alteripontixanthobacter muriae]
MKQPVALPGNPSDKLQHMAAFCVLALLAAIAYPRVSLPVILLGLSFFGALIEMIQVIPALNRSAEWRDLAADILAAATALGVIAIARSMRGREPSS